MLQNILADLIVIIHFLFILFVIFGGILSQLNIKWTWVHIPALLWGVSIELTGWICPLTPLENALRQSGSGSAYQNSFIEHYIEAVVYPVGLTRKVQIILGTVLLAFNAIVYFSVFLKRRRQNSNKGGT